MTAAPLSVVVINASPNAESKTVTLAGLVVEEIRTRFADARVEWIPVYHLGPGFTSAIVRDDVDAPTEQALRAVALADVLVVAVPVHKGSYPGMFKHFIDLLDPYDLAGTPVLLVATGGSERHSLVIDQVLRPLFGFFQAWVAPVGIYAAAASFDGQLVLDPSLYSRAVLAVDDVEPLVRGKLAAARADTAQ